MASKENVTPLKTLVISMGFLLVGGTVLLAAIVWKKVSAEVERPAQVASCPGGHIDLRGQGDITATTVEGKVMRVVAEQARGKTAHYLIDMCTGVVITRLILETDGGPPGR